MTRAPETARAVARIAAAAFGGEPQVHRFWDERKEHWVDLLDVRDRPSSGICTYSTLTLHETPNLLDGTDIRVELAGVAPEDAGEFPNMLATAAFFVIKDRWLCAPGVVFPDLVTEYSLSPTLRHVLWVPPFPWGHLGSIDMADNFAVHWLLAIPISDAERHLLVDQGFDTLEAALAGQEVPYFDLDRPSVV